jgi:hypothetical protein
MADNKQIFPWGLHPMEPWIKEELDRRASEYDLNPTSNIQTEKYSGPKTAWGRVFSNGISKLAEDREGFVMGGTEGFDESYGFGSDGKVTIGVDAMGLNHEIDSTYDKSQNGLPDFPHRPPPSIVSIDSEFSGGSNSSFNAMCRKTKITWKCFSLAQLEYLTPYFLTPRISILVEWGWNHYKTESLTNLLRIDDLYSIFQGNPEIISKKIKDSNGNYDLAMGFITDYTYSLNEFGGYDCTTTITNANYLIEGKSYHNRNDNAPNKNDKTKKTKIKDFIEFVFDNLDNLSEEKNNSKKFPSKNSAYDNFNLSIKGKIFKTEKQKYLKMDLVAEILNKFFEIKMLDGSSIEKSSIGTFDISDVLMNAHPALKSTSENFIIPNQFAPRFVTTPDQKTKVVDGKKLTEAKTPSGDYYNLFPNIKTIMADNNFDEKYDDLIEALNEGGAISESFPRYYNYTDDNTNSTAAGYWGYLSDIFISVSHFKYLVNKNDTQLKLIEELLQSISEATCNICQLQLQSNIGSTNCRPHDVNFSTRNTTKDAENLMRISIGSINSAFIKSADFSVKLSGEMSNQMVMQSASGKELPEGYGTSNYDAKTMKVSQFAYGDRMFDRGVIDVIVSDKSEKTPDHKNKYIRLFTENNSNLVVYETKKVKTGEKEKRKYILAEKNPNYIKTIILDSTDKKAVYTNNAIMPGTEFKMELLGIGGITFLSQFTLDHVPSSYNYERCVWQVSQVSQKIENKIWTTSITAQARPLTSLEET